MQSSYYCYSQHQTLCLEHLLPESSNSKGFMALAPSHLVPGRWMFKQVGAEETGLLQAEMWWRLVGGVIVIPAGTAQSRAFKSREMASRESSSETGQARPAWAMHTHCTLLAAEGCIHTHQRRGNIWKVFWVWCLDSDLGTAPLTTWGPTA